MSLHSPKAFDKMDYWIFSMNKNFFLQKLSAVTISQNKRWKRYTKVAAILKMGKKQDGKFFRGKFHHGIFYSHLKHRGKYISGGAWSVVWAEINHIEFSTGSILVDWGEIFRPALHFF